MPKLRKTPRYFVAIRRAKGRVTYKWEPSAILRALGWKTQMLGDDYVAAIAKAAALNQELDAWRAGAGAQRAANNTPANRFHASWADLEMAFRTDAQHGLPSKSAKTQKEYDSRMRWLRSWAEGGKTRLSDITKEVAEDLRDTLVYGSSAYKASSILRVFSLLMTYAEKRAKMIPRGSDPSKQLDVPTPPRRRKAISFDAMEYLATTARALDLDRMALAVELGFLCIQRAADWRIVKRINWREMHDIDPADRAILAGPDGKVFGFRIQQGKTSTWVGCAVDQGTRAKVEARIAAMHERGFNYVLFYDGDGRDPDGLWHERQFNRDWNAVKAAAIDAATAAGDDWLVEQLETAQYRDLRRSGMCWMRDMGSTKEQIAARSGHEIGEVEDILKTYMPANERGSAAAFATAISTAQGRKQERHDV